MQVFNSFQEMAVGTGALGAQSTMSVFNAMPQEVEDDVIAGWKRINGEFQSMIETIENYLYSTLYCYSLTLIF